MFFGYVKLKICIVLLTYYMKKMSYLSLEDLAAAVSSENQHTIEENLIHIDKNLSLEISNKILIISLLNINNGNINKISAELIAEWAKESSNRIILTDETIINILLDWVTSKDPALIINSARGLANICYENEKAANFVNKKYLQNILLNINPANKECNDITAKLVGMLANILNFNDELAKYSINNNIIDKIELVLAISKHSLKENETLISLTLSLVNVLSDYYNELNVYFSESFFESLLYIFKTSANPEIAVKCLEICHGQSEKDEVLLLFAQKGICELLFVLIEKYKCKVNDEETRSVLNMACDLLVTILTKDESMSLIYDHGKGSMYSSMVGWLESDNSDLLCSGIMALGNFARNEQNCIQMVQTGLSKKLIDVESSPIEKVSDKQPVEQVYSELIVFNQKPDFTKESSVTSEEIEISYMEEPESYVKDEEMESFLEDSDCSVRDKDYVLEQESSDIDLLSHHNSKDSDLKIQHAILSTLKNLAIPTQNKSKLLEEGLIDVIYPIIETDQYLVIFKLLGTLRMVIKEQDVAAMDLVSKKEFLEKLVHWYNNSDHLGVRVEVPRLISWLIKSCHSFKPIPILLAVEDCVIPVVEMISSNFEVMQNEAFYALHFLITGCSKLSDQVLKEKHVNGLSNNTSSENGDLKQLNCKDDLLEKIYSVLVKADIGKHINFFISNYFENINRATVENLVTLLELLLKSDIIRNHLDQIKLEESLKNLSVTTNDENDSKKIENLIELFNKSQ